MSLLDFLGSAAGVAGDMAGDEVKRNAQLDAQKQMAKMNEELLIQREQTIQALRDKRNAEIGAGIEEESQNMSRQRVADLLNQKRDWNNPDGSTGTLDGTAQVQANDPAVDAILKNPEAMKAYGIIGRTRAQEMDDKAGIAEKRGNLDFAKEFRSQQQIENARVGEERKTRAMETSNALKERDLERKAEHDQNWLEVQMERDATNWARISAMIGKDSSKSDHTNAEMIKSIDSDRKEISGKIKTAQEAKKTAYKQDDIRKLDEEIETYKKEFEDLGKRKKVLYDRLGFGDDKAESTPAKSKQDVRVNGKVIGQASTQEEAAALVAEWKKRNK